MLGGRKLPEKDVDDMPIWQDHEQRITALEFTTKSIESEFKEVKGMINKGNTEQSKKLEVIDKRLMDEFFNKQYRNHKYGWKLAIKIVSGIVGGGGLLYLLIEKVIGG